MSYLGVSGWKVEQMSKCPFECRTIIRLVKVIYIIKALGVDKEKMFFEFAV